MPNPNFKVAYTLDEANDVADALRARFADLAEVSLYDLTAANREQAGRIEMLLRRDFDATPVSTRPRPIDEDMALNLAKMVDAMPGDDDDARAMRAALTRLARAVQAILDTGMTGTMDPADAIEAYVAALLAEVD